MPERRRFRREELFDRIRSISSGIPRPIKAYMIGGLAMMHYGLQDSTKDVDLVFASKEDASIFQRTLEKEGFYKPIELEGDYSDLNAQAVYTSTEGYRFDIFVRRVCGKLVLSRDMMDRSRELEIGGNLELYTVSPEDIFIFKGITSREDDLSDMFLLCGRGLDWEAIEGELRDQPESWKWLGIFHDRLIELEDNYPSESPLTKRIGDDADISILMCSILQILKTRPTSKEEIMAHLDEDDHGLLEEAVKRMRALGLIGSENDSLFQTGKGGS